MESLSGSVPFLRRGMMRITSISSLFMAVMNLILYSGLAYFPIFIQEYSLLDSLSSSLNRFPPGETFDFIIVGAGTTGSILANRLSEHFTVLLLEAGGEPNPLQAIPAMSGLFPNNPTLDWIYKTIPQKHSCLSLNNQGHFKPQFYGYDSSSRAFMNFFYKYFTNLNSKLAYIRGNPNDYDNWANLTGDSRWSYENFLPFFKKAENYLAEPDGEFDQTYHGTNGELNIEKTSYNLLAPYFVNAAQELGYNQRDLNAPGAEGFSEFVFTIKNGRRWGSFQAFLDPLRTRNNLVIRKYSEAYKILFLGSENLAYGVEYENFGFKYQALAKNEIILSAGTIGNPKILMLSGVGPSEHLKEFGIRSLVDSPGVGSNLQDHVIGLVGPFTINQKLTFLLDRDSGPRHLIEYFTRGTGPLSSSGVQATGFISSSIQKEKDKLKDEKSKWPDNQILLLGLPIHEQGPELLAQLFNLKSDIAEEYYRPVAGKDSFHIMSIISRPKSKGTIRLASENFKDSPLIDPNYLENPEDSKIILEGMKFALEMVENTKSFQSLNATLSSKPFPSCSHLEYRSDDYFSCYLKHYTLSVYHPAGTCAMGKSQSSGAVVDSSLRVLGTQNLRVIDASIMPEIVSSNIQATCIAIGEMGSRFILEDWDKGNLIK